MAWEVAIFETYPTKGAGERATEKVEQLEGRKDR